LFFLCFLFFLSLLLLLCPFSPRTVKRSAGTIKEGDVINGFRRKTAKEIWCGDTGAYPVMGVIAFACVFCVVAGVGLMMKTPDARITKTQRKSPMRGEFIGER
jgi:hypothetical protein